MYGPSRFDEDRAFKTEGKGFLDTDRPRPGNNILWRKVFIFWLSFYTNENRTVWRDVCRARVSAEKSYKCQLRIEAWQSSIRTEEMVPSDELVYCFYRFCTLTGVGQSSQHLNSCVVKYIYASAMSTYQIHQQSSTIRVPDKS